MNDEIKLTKQEAQIILDRPEDCVWERLVVWRDESIDHIWDEDKVSEAIDHIYASAKNKIVPANLTKLEAEVMFDCVGGGTWLVYVQDSDSYGSTPQWRSRARKSFKTLCEKLEAINPPGGWEIQPYYWSGGV